MPGRKGEETRWRSSRTKRERERRVDKGSMEIERGRRWKRAETERRKEEKLLNVAAKWNGN